MTLTDECDIDLVYQMTQHAMLIPWGRFARRLHLSEQMREAVRVKRHKDAAPGGDLVLEFGLAALAGYEYLRDLNYGSHPLGGDQAVADAWDIEFRHYSTVSRFLYDLDDEGVAGIEAKFEAILRPYVHQAVHEVLCQQEYLTLCGDLTGRPVSAYSTTYPPDAVFGYMAHQLRKGHQVALVTLKGVRHRIHIAAFHHSGDTVSGPCLRQMVTETELRLGCRPRRRVELVQQRLTELEADIAHKQNQLAAKRVKIRTQIERQGGLGNQLQTLQIEIAQLEEAYQGKRVRPHSRLSLARRRQASVQRQLQSALRQESQARRILARYQDHLERLQAQRNDLVCRLAQFEVDNAELAFPVRIRWLLDGGFGDAANVTMLIELGYDVYAMVHNGQTTTALLKQLPVQATWTQVGTRTQACETSQQQLGDCPHPVRLTLLRWQAGDSQRHTTLISYTDGAPLPTKALFPAYHQRQDIEAGFKQGKSAFSLTKLRLRSAAGIRLLEQFALLFWPNFVPWAAQWLAGQLHDDTGRFTAVLQQMRPQVRVAANTPALVCTNSTGQCLQFDCDGPFAGVIIYLDGDFAYQMPLPLFQTWQQLWPISSASVKERLATITVNQNSPALTSIPVGGYEFD